MFKIQVRGNEHTVECDYCGKREYIGGPFVTGLETPASVQRALQSHHLASPKLRAVFDDKPCDKQSQWVDGSWVVFDGAGQTIDQGNYAMVEGDPVVDPKIDAPTSGTSDWDTRRVDKLAAMEIAASPSPGRARTTMIDQGSGNVLVNLARKDGKYEPVFIARSDLHVTKISDEDIRKKIQARLIALAAANL